MAAPICLEEEDVNASSDSEVTRRLASWLVASRGADIPGPVRREAVRSLLNWVGCTVGGARHAAVDSALAALRPFAGREQASLLGRRECIDILHASLLNGIASHVFDFDDTHLRTIIHPAGPVAASILALGEHRHISGEAFLHAFVLGVEVECRIGNAVYPEHYDVGWHITGTAGVFGAAAACGKLLGEQGFTSSERVLEAPRGFSHVMSTARKFEEITGELGAHYEVSLNSYKP